MTIAIDKPNYCRVATAFVATVRGGRVDVHVFNAGPFAQMFQTWPIWNVQIVPRVTMKYLMESNGKPTGILRRHRMLGAWAASTHCGHLPSELHAHNLHVLNVAFGKTSKAK
mmetsp:Transcript_42919/g.87786  ORF Transcript_42919/g.87786 Transcript_42919/m.87786 type:complete len:112 (-) Transcript_42919:246-581(-)